GGGQLQFTLPVALPPGIKSVAPQINLVYTSGSGNGIAGYGWSISGITSISRMGKTIEVDSEVKGVKLDYTDYYSFNGQRLILKSGVYGKDGAEYATEKFSNVKITSKGTISGQAWQGPEYWEVTFEDGSQAWYGNTATGTNNARTPIEYNIVKWKDAQGNYITYTYSQSNNVAVISSIQWGGNETLSKSHFNTITFNYITRDLKESSYIKGINFIQEKLLSNIVVNASGSQFKKYGIEYKKDSNGTDYQFVKAIQEYNSQNEYANKAEFDYTSSQNGQIEKYSYTDNDSKSLIGDFDGDGRMDYIKFFAAHQDCTKYEEQYIDVDPLDGVPYYDNVCVEWKSNPAGFYLFKGFFDNNKKDKIFIGNDTNISSITNALTVRLKDSENHYRMGQGFVIPKYSNSAINNLKKDIELRYYYIDNDQLVYRNSTVISADKYDLSYEEPNWSGNDESSKLVTTVQFKNIDVNGDGISELFMLFTDNYWYRERYDQYDPHTWEPHYSATYRYKIFNDSEGLSLDNKFSDVTSSFDISSPTGSPYDIMTYGDFDGNGLDDLLLYDYYTKKYKLVTFKKVVDSDQYTSVSSSFTIDTGAVTGIGYQGVVGDFNGDGKSDLLVPEAKGSSDWKLYISTGTGFKSKTISNLAYYNPSSNDGAQKPTYTNRTYMAQDLDLDGKSDFIYFSSDLRLLKYSTRTSYKLETKFVTDDLEFSRKYDPYTSNIFYGGENDRMFYSIIAGNFNINNSYDQILVVRKGALEKRSFYNLGEEARLRSITQGGITTSIDYKELDPTVNPDFYAQTKKEQYPYVELERVSQSYAVSQLRQTIPVNGVNEIRKQDFRYRGLITHLQGKGMIGFRQTARSSWYADGFEGTKIWSGAEIDPLNEGVPIKEWSVKTNTEAQIFPTNLSESNTNLLSFKSTTYQNNKLLNGNVVTSYGSADKPKIVTALIPLSSVSKDFMKDIRTESTITYDSNYLPTKTVRNVNSGFAVSTTDLEYNNNASGTGKDYYIGRPKTKTETVQVYSDTKSGKEEYTYENNLLKTLKTYNRDNTGWFLETYAYDGFGNVTQKNITSSIDSNIKTDKTQYDDKGRFVMKKIDNLNLVTTITYNDWGQVLTQTDPLGNSVTNEYDGWGKLLKSKNKLSGYTTYTYEKDSNGNTIVKEYLSDGGINISYTNKIGQVYKKTSKSFGSGKYISAETKYDVLGRKISESEPYFEGASASQWNTIEYDEYSRPIKATAFTGKIVTSVYSGRVVTTTETNANNRFKKQTSDPIGNITSSEDLGGVINFKYNAAGENTEASYGGNVVTTAYDAWGNKVSLDDPSNGKYEYTYAGYFGSISKTKSPKGEKTYTYNSKGQLTTQTEKTTDGTNNTDKTISITYDNNGLITAKSGTSLGKSYSSGITYDSFGRVLSSYENSNGKYYMRKGITYDDQSRVVSYEKSLYSSGVYTKVTIQNVYDTWSGEMYQVKNKSTGKVLWELQQTNAKGQVEKAKLGGTNINNLYGTNGYLISSNQTSALDQSTLLQVSYTFNAIKNELTGRTRGGDFNILESFEYDSNNRLTKWTNPATGLNNTNTYDVKGRITNNDQVGNVKYETTGKIYRPSGMTLNSVGEQNYTNDLVQSIVYNENNDPVFIDGLKGDVAFEYGLTGMRQVAYYGGNFDQPSGNEQPDSKFTKYYSEDGSYEIIRNNQTGKEKHLLYIGGSPYESNIVYLKDYDSGSGKFVFLHKDYLGSILAISDESGTGIEQRHYDAWGNLTHL
ncbi:SpvB/TcaC N-terminal domain-containing protein, partial [Weeksellaceae bacterium A-14]